MPNSTREQESKGELSMTRYTPEQVIRLVVSENPKKQGSAAHSRFAVYKDGMTVKEFVDAGGRTADLNHDADKNYVNVEPRKK